MRRRNFILTGLLGTVAGFLGISPAKAKAVPGVVFPARNGIFYYDWRYPGTEPTEPEFPKKVWGQRTLEGDTNWSEFNQRRLYHAFSKDWNEHGVEGTLARMQPSMRKIVEPIVRGPFWMKMFG